MRCPFLETSNKKIGRERKGRMDWLQSTDDFLLLWIQDNLRADIWTPFWKGITFLGDGGWFWIALAVILLFKVSTRKAGILSLLSMGTGALITNLLLKPMIARTRPYEAISGLVLLVGKQHDYSFPSGHTCASFACALILWKMFPGKKGIFAVILAIGIAFSRLYVGVHYPSDVLGGFFVGLLSSELVYWLNKRVEAAKKEEVT